MRPTDPEAPTIAGWMREQPSTTPNRPDEPAPSEPLAMVLVAGIAALMAITALAAFLKV